MADDGQYLSGMSAGVVIDGEVWELGEWHSYTHTVPLDTTDSESDRTETEEITWVFNENIDDLTNRLIRIQGIFDSGAMPLTTGRVYEFKLEASDMVVYTTQARVADIRQLTRSPVLQTVEIEAVSTGIFSPAIA